MTTIPINQTISVLASPPRGRVVVVCDEASCVTRSLQYRDGTDGARDIRHLPVMRRWGPAWARLGAMDFLEMMALEPHGTDTYVGTGPAYPWGGLYGGQIVAQALRAAGHTVEDRFLPHSLHAYFIRPGDHTEPIRFEVDRLRNGRSFVTRQVVARQSNGAILTMIGSFQTPEESPDVQAATMPDVPGPDVDGDACPEPIVLEEDAPEGDDAQATSAPDDAQATSGPEDAQATSVPDAPPQAEPVLHPAGESAWVAAVPLSEVPLGIAVPDLSDLPGLTEQAREPVVALAVSAVDGTTATVLRLDDRDRVRTEQLTLANDTTHVLEVPSGTVALWVLPAQDVGVAAALHLGHQDVVGPYLTSASLAQVPWTRAVPPVVPVLP